MNCEKNTIIVTPIPSGPRFIDLTGQTFGHLLVLSYHDSPNGVSRWVCECKCGNIVTVRSTVLKRTEGVRSCGCWKREQAILRYTTHGMAHSPEYHAYYGAYRRCMELTCPSYPSYGGRGIKFLYASFDQFHAELGNRPSPKHSLDRKDVHGHYEPGNCRWSTSSEQARNTQKTRRVVKDGVVKSIADWADAVGINAHTIYTRLTVYGWCDACSLLPLYSRCPHIAK